MKPISLTATAIATLTFQKFIESGTGELAKKFTEAATTKMDELRKRIWTKLQSKPSAESALASVEKGSKADLDSVAAYLQIAMIEDPKFASEVKFLARESSAGKLADLSNMAQNNYDQAKGWQTKVENGIAYIGEIHIQGQPPNS